MFECKRPLGKVDRTQTAGMQLEHKSNQIPRGNDQHQLETTNGKIKKRREEICDGTPSYAPSKTLLVVVLNL